MLVPFGITHAAPALGFVAVVVDIELAASGLNNGDKVEYMAHRAVKFCCRLLRLCHCMLESLQLCCKQPQLPH